MNYLAHLFLAKPTADSQFGNLLGDFQRGVNISRLQRPVRQGVENHILVDKFTDAHTETLAAKHRFRRSLRRFAPIAIDVLFDHFLIKHWQAYTDESFSDFCEYRYDLLRKRLPLMPERMQTSVRHMTDHHGLAVYKSLHGVDRALCHLSTRIRFDNPLHRAIDDIEHHYDQLDAHFQAFFPELISHVRLTAHESG